MREAVIKITPDDVPGMDVQTGAVTNLEMLENLNVLVKHFAQEIIKEAQEMGCDEGEDFEDYIRFLRKNQI